MAEEERESKAGAEFESSLRSVKKALIASGAPVEDDTALAVCKTAELFIEGLVSRAGAPLAAATAAAAAEGGGSAHKKRLAVTYDAVAAAVEEWEPCGFLKEFIPKRVRAEVLIPKQEERLKQQQEQQQQGQRQESNDGGQEMTAGAQGDDEGGLGREDAADAAGTPGQDEPGTREARTEEQDQA